MANLATTDNIFDRLFDFRRDFNDLFGNMSENSTQGNRRRPSLIVAVPPIEAWIDPNDKKYHLSIALAGVNPNDIQLNIQGNTLTVSGEHKSENEKKDANYLQREFSYDQFERTIELPEIVDAQGLTAQYNNGLLEITAPLKAEALPKQIEVKTASSTPSNQQSTSQSASAKAAAGSS